MAPKVDRGYKEARKSQIINAAGQCFSQKGFHNTTMKDIFEVSGLSSGAVYNYFESKEEIVETMADISFERNMKMITGAVEEDGESPLGKFLNG
ncbi:MAG: TetR/AcrR family transcriptional regulator, partial [Actinomycetia bacterium]|nr:TetR/AcrR family transcriptional regulator [Actinomycetes bacterium]